MLEVFVGPRKVYTSFGRNCEEYGRKESKEATEKEKRKSNPEIRHVLREQ